MVTDDPMLVRWGLDVLLEDYSGYSSTGVGRTSVQTNDNARTEFLQPGESYTVRGYSSVENDEVIAHALQEELAEGSEKSQDWCDWPGPFSGMAFFSTCEISQWENLKDFLPFRVAAGC